jgi:hypothetical protein
MPNIGAGSRLNNDPNEIKAAPKNDGATVRQT